MLQPHLNVKLSQRQILTPGLVQMVSVLALNKVELKDMINGELVANPVLEEIDEATETLDERAAREGSLEQSAAETSEAVEQQKKDPFEEIDFGSYFQDYLDPGYRTSSSFEDLDKPSFEQFLSQPNTLTDHLMWQIGSMTLSQDLRLAVELIIGNLDENGYLTASNEELARSLEEILGGVPTESDGLETAEGLKNPEKPEETERSGRPGNGDGRSEILVLVEKARAVVARLDPAGVGARDLRECLLTQVQSLRHDLELARLRRRRAAQDSGRGNEPSGQDLEQRLALTETAGLIISEFLGLLQKKDIRELVRLCRRPAEWVEEAVDLIRTLDPRPGQRYIQSEARLIEPDVAFVKRDDQYVVVMNDEDMPSLRLNRSYRRMLREKSADREVRDYVKERYKSAIQLLRNIEQRKNTILRTCEAIVRRQREFLDRGVEHLRPMMIKEVAEEIDVHPSTVSRAVANKYVHTAQGVFELRFFFSEGVGGPEGGDLPLLLLKRRVKKLIEEEDPRKPWTDEYLAAELQRQGIHVTRRTVAKYREDMQIPSTHQRRRR
ncbi:MAG: RNA polymerase sigma-54 factor [Acidobacteriota bacterium]